MKSLVFSPGKASIGELGAARVVTANLFYGQSDILEGTLIGVQKFIENTGPSSKFTQLDIQSDLNRKTLIYRMIAKIIRGYGTDSAISASIMADINDRVSVIADGIASKHAYKIFKSQQYIKYALGFSTMSFSIGKVAKDAGRKYVIHSQWCHPFVQNENIMQAYDNIGLTPPKVHAGRINRQLSEFELADKIWCPSELVKRSLINNGVPDEKLFVSYLGVDVARFRVHEPTRHENDRFLILFVGNVAIQKGIHVLLKALDQANISNIDMVFNGQADVVSTELINKYRSRLEKKNIAVFIDPGDPRRHHKRASLFVLPSVHDAFGIVVPEAMAAGLPVIISDQAGASEIIRHGENGYIFPSSDAEKLAEYIEYLYQNLEIRRSFGEVSCKLAESYDLMHTSKSILSKIEKI